MEENELFEIELVENTSLEAGRIAPSVDIGGGGGGGQSNSNSSNNAADMP